MMCCNTSIDMIQIVFRYMLLRVRENERPKRKDSEDKNDVNLLDVFNLIFVFCSFFLSLHSSQTITNRWQYVWQNKSEYYILGSHTHALIIARHNTLHVIGTHTTTTKHLTAPIEWVVFSVGLSLIKSQIQTDVQCFKIFYCAMILERQKTRGGKLTRKTIEKKANKNCIQSKFDRGSHVPALNTIPFSISSADPFVVCESEIAWNSNVFWCQNKMHILSDEDIFGWKFSSSVCMCVCETATRHQKIKYTGIGAIHVFV